MGIGVEDDLLKACRIGMEQMKGLEGVLADPPTSAYIVALGDSSVQVRYRGWVDQRNHDFWLVRSEAIRCVKLALERAGLDMPEPIYRVHWSGPAPASAGAHGQQARVAAAAGEDAAAVPDTRARSDLDRQIDLDQQASDATNLLDQGAPRE